jgi:SGNH domain (fused to AT3 domains)
MTKCRLSVVLSILLVSYVSPCFSGSASATSSTIKPGSAAQVKVAVAASTSIKKAPMDLSPSIQFASFDGFSTTYPEMTFGCATLTQCVLGDTSSSKTIIALGDSHAAMWLPAITPFAFKHHYKIIVLMTLGCPAADLTIDNPADFKEDATCNAQRSTDIDLINSYKPNYVLLADKTSGAVSNSTNRLATSSQWQSAETDTIALLQPSQAKIAIIGDINVFPIDPDTCLAAYTNNVQKCSVTNPDTTPAEQGNQPAERAAAKAMGVDYINTLPWLCTSSKCSPVIGHFIAYADADHIDMTYSAYLSTVMGHKLEALTK